MSRTLVAGVCLSSALLIMHNLVPADEQAAAVDVAAAMRASFEAKKQAAMERVEQDETQALCTAHAPGPLPAAVAARIRSTNQATIKPPRDGKYLGDHERGEAIAQRGTGLQWSDDPAEPAGGNCYACHELAASEIAYGTIGPSLRHYGKLRGESTAVLEYTWAKLYNSNVHMPCSTMPRFGHRGILTEQQLQDVMAFLFDPASAVNQ
jgi:sulfur-oxidizing protein SoxX